MSTKLIMVEGIQGSGKSTTAKKIAAYYKKQNHVVNLYSEGQAHPADLAWCAYVPLDSIDGLLHKYKEIELEIRNNMHIEGDYAIVAYTLVKTKDMGFFKELEQYEIYNKRVPADVFKEVLFSRWGNFAQQAYNLNQVNIFECAFLQNHVSELMNFQLANEYEIEKHINELVSIITCLSPVLIYLSPIDTRATIERVSEERNFAYGKWIDAIIGYTENMPYGKLNKLKGIDGVVSAIETRKKIELNIINKLPIRTMVFENHDYDWDNQWKSIENYLSKL